MEEQDFWLLYIKNFSCVRAFASMYSQNIKKCADMSKNGDWPYKQKRDFA
jgi:hypothetical protein